MKIAVNLFAAILLLSPFLAQAGEQSGHVFLRDIVTEKNRIHLYLTGHVEPEVTMKADPPRVIIDLPGVNYGNVGRVLPGVGGVIKRIRTALVSGEAENLRLVLDLSRPGPFSQAWKDDRLTVAFGAHAEEIETASETASDTDIESETASETASDTDIESEATPTTTSEASFEEDYARAKAAAKPAPKPVKKASGDAPIPISELYGVVPGSETAEPDTEEPPIPISELYKTPPAAAGTQSPPVPSMVAAVPASAPVSAGEDAQGYMVQLGSFKDEKRAQALRSEIAASISFVNISEVTVNGVRYYRVGVGPYKVRAQAQAMVAELAEMGHQAMVLVNRKP